MRQDQPTQFTTRSALQLIDTVKDNKRRLRNLPRQRKRPSEYKPGGGGGQLALINTTTGPIPGRTDLTTAGQGKAVLCSVATDGTITEGATADVYSWVTTASGDPQYHVDQQIYIWLEKGLDGKWWYTGEDCRPTEIFEGSPSADYTMTTTLSLVPGTDVLWDGAPGIYMLIANLDIDVSGVPGNQFWDANIGLWDITDGVQIGSSLDISGNGSPDGLLFYDAAVGLPVSGDVWGHSFGLGAQRTTTTGDVVMAQTSKWQLVGAI